MSKQMMLGYLRVSTDEQAESGNGLEAQRAAIAAEASRRGWDVEYFSDDGVSGKVMGPQLLDALQQLASGQADGLVVAKMDRLARSVLNAANIIESAQSQRWTLVLLDMGLDLSTPQGEAMAGMLAVFAQFERRMISDRTKAALAAKRDRGERVGRPRMAKPGVVRRIVMDRNAGQSFDQIAKALEAEGVLSPAGRPTWQSSTVRRIYNAANAAAPVAVSA